MSTTTSTLDAIATVALREATQAAVRCYLDPADVARIHLGAALVRTGGVTLIPATSTTAAYALVQSGTRLGATYTVNEACTCPDFTDGPHQRCKHRFAVSLLKKAQALVRELWFVTLVLDDADDVCGIVYPRPDGVWALYAEGLEGEPPLLTTQVGLIFGGNCGIYVAQAHADGPLWAKVADSGQYHPWRRAR